MKILFAAKVKIHFVPLLEMEILFVPGGPANFVRETRCFQRGKSGKGKCGRAEIGHTAHAAKVQIVRIIQMNSRSEYKNA